MPEPRQLLLGRLSRRQGRNTGMSAEEALEALALDLLEQVSLARAIELAEDPESLALARFNIKPFQRTERVHGKVVTEQVGAHSAEKTGLGLPHPATGSSMQHPGDLSHIPDDAWLRGQQEWIAKGEAIWKKNEWKSRGKPKTHDQVRSDIDNTVVEHGLLRKSKENPAYSQAYQHLTNAKVHLNVGRAEQQGKTDQDASASAYHELSKAHQHLAEHVVPHAKQEEYPEVAKHLQRISGHMMDLDRAMGQKPETTRKLLGGFKENFQHAGEVHGEEEHRKAIARAAHFEDGDEVRHTPTGKVGKVIQARVTNKPGSENNRWYVQFPGEFSSQDYSGADLMHTESGGTAKDVASAQFEHDWLHRRVQVGDKAPSWVKDRIGPGAGTVVDVAPKEEVWDSGAEMFIPPGSGDVLVKLDSQAEPVLLNVHSLTDEQLTPKKGAAAVHPHLGGHLQRLPGETISSGAYRHVARPFDMAQPNPDQAARGAAEQRAQQAQVRLGHQREQTAAAREERMNAAALERMGVSPPGAYAPLTDEQFAHHTQQVEQKLGEAFDNGLSTEDQFTEDGEGQIWDADRSSVHHDIIKAFLDKTVDIPSDRHAVLLGGLAGAGKSSLLRNLPGVDLKDYAVVNPDSFKEELARRGMVPEVEGLSPMEASTLVRMEASHLANLATAELLRRGKNVILDVTMKSRRVMRPRLDQLDHANYRTTGVFLDTPLEKATKRATGRYRSGLEAYREGKDPLGGRYIPASVMAASEAEPGMTYNRRTFDALRDRFGAWQLWDGTGPKAAPIGQSHGSGDVRTVPGPEGFRKPVPIAFKSAAPPAPSPVHGQVGGDWRNNSDGAVAYALTTASRTGKDIYAYPSPSGGSWSTGRVPFGGPDTYRATPQGEVFHDPTGEGPEKQLNPARVASMTQGWVVEGPASTRPAPPAPEPEQKTGPQEPDSLLNRATPLTGDQKFALRRYTSPDVAEAVNGALRTGQPLSFENLPTGESIPPQDIIDQIRSSMAPVREPQTMWRVMLLPPGNDPQPGSTVRDKGFTSLTANREFAASWGSSQASAAQKLEGRELVPHLLRVEVPAGALAAPGSTYAQELVLNDGHAFEYGQQAQDGTWNVRVVPPDLPGAQYVGSTEKAAAQAEKGTA